MQQRGHSSHFKSFQSQYPREKAGRSLCQPGLRNELQASQGYIRKFQASQGCKVIACGKKSEAATVQSEVVSVISQEK